MVTEGVLVDIGLGLSVVGLERATDAGRGQVASLLRKGKYSERVDDLGTKFSDILREAIADIDAETDTKELADVADDWERVVDQLERQDAFERDEDGLIVFESEDDAVRAIAEAIAAAQGYDLDDAPVLERELRRAVTAAYRRAISAFAAEIADSPLAEELATEASINAVSALRDVEERLTGLESLFTPAEFYELYPGDESGLAAAANDIEVEQRVEYVSRPELSGSRDAERVLLLGPGGAGKSRTMAERLRSYAHEVGHVVRPGPALQSASDLLPLQSESFDGDVLLVWDDIHDVSPETDNTVFRKAVTELETMLERDGHELHALATARTGHKGVLPGNYERSDSPLWEPFDVQHLEPLETERLAALVDRATSEYDVTATDEVRAALVEKARSADPSPVYVTSIVGRASGGELTAADVEGLPANALEFWENRYAEIREEGDERRYALWAVALLEDIGIPLYESLLEGVYEHVLDRAVTEFGPCVERLEREQWLVSGEDGTRYVAHDVKVEAVDEPTEDPRRLKTFSEFLLGDVEWYLPADAKDVERVVHGKFGVFTQELDSGRTNQLAEKHYRHVLTVNPEDQVTHLNYARLLEELERYEEAEKHYKRAIEIDPDQPSAHLNYGSLLGDLERYEEAERHYERVIELDPDYGEVHLNYGALLKKMERYEKAEQHLEQAIKLSIPGAHLNYGNLLKELERYEEAKQHYNQFIDLDSPESHGFYANRLKELERFEEAEQHYERAIELDPDSSKAHRNYAQLLEELKRYEEAKQHYERVINLAPDSPQGHYEYAILLTRMERYEEAKQHYERVIDLAPESPEVHYNYADLLIETEELSEAQSHLERSVGLWLDRGNTANAIHDLQTLVEACEARGEHKRAHNRCEQALELLEDANESIVKQHALDVAVQYANLEVLEPEAIILESYSLALGHHLKEDLNEAAALLRNAWDCREETDQEAVRSFARAAGVIMSAYAELSYVDVQPSEILEEVDPERMEPTEAALYEHLTAGSTDTTPDELRALPETDEAFEQHEILQAEARVCANLLERLAEQDSE